MLLCSTIYRLVNFADSFCFNLFHRYDLTILSNNFLSILRSIFIMMVNINLGCFYVPLISKGIGISTSQLFIRRWANFKTCSNLMNWRSAAALYLTMAGVLVNFRLCQGKIYKDSGQYLYLEDKPSIKPRPSLDCFTKEM